MTYRRGGYGGTFFNPDDIRPATATHPGLMSSADFAKLATLQVPVSRLTYAPNVDHMNGAAVAATTWTDVHANQTFTVGSATAWLAIEIKLGLIATSAALAQIAARVNFNSGGTPVLVMFGEGIVSPAAGFGDLSGTLFFVSPAVLPTGANTIKVQIFGAAALTAYCRPNTQPNTEFYSLRVVELSV